MNKQFYRSRNIPVQHPMLLPSPCPPAQTHQLPRMCNMEKVINKQILSHYQSKSKQMELKQSMDTVVKQAHGVRGELEREREENKGREVEYQKIIMEKNTKMFMLFLQINRLSHINTQFQHQLCSLQLESKNIHLHYSTQLTHYKHQLLSKSQSQLKALKQQFSTCIDQLKFKYSEKLGLLMKKDKQQELRVIEYKEIIRIMEMEGEVVKRQRERLEEEIKELKGEMKEKVRVMSGELGKRRQMELELVMKCNQYEVGKVVMEEKYQKVVRLNKMYEEEREREMNKVMEREINLKQIVSEEQNQESHQIKINSLKDNFIEPKSNIKQTSSKKLFSSSHQDRIPSHHKVTFTQPHLPQNSSKDHQISSLRLLLSQQQQTHLSQIQSLQSSIISLNLLITKLQNQNLTLKQQNNKLTILLDNMKRASQKAIDDKEYQIKQYRVRLGEYEGELGSLREMLGRMEGELQEHREKNKEYMEILDMKSSRQISVDVEQMRRENQELMEKVEGLRKELEEKDEEIERLNGLLEDGRKGQNGEEEKEEEQEEQKEHEDKQEQKNQQKEYKDQLFQQSQSQFSQFVNNQIHESQYFQHFDPNKDNDNDVL